MDWEIYSTGRGYRAECYAAPTQPRLPGGVLRGAHPTPLAVIRSRWRPMLYVRMTLAQWWHSCRG